MIKLYEPKVTLSDIKSVVYALGRCMISGNSQIVRDFEHKFANYIGTKYAVAVNSGTSALQTALHAVGVGPGDEVIVPSFTIISCANAVLAVGAVPVLVGVDRDTWCIDFEQVKAAITDRTKAILPVDMFGHPVNMWRFPTISRVLIRGKGTIYTVEDACQALGASCSPGTYHPDTSYKCGKMATASCFSLYPNKTITSGEGGMITTDNIDIYNKAKGYSSLYFGDRNKFEHRDIGFNFRMSGLNAALAHSQLDRIDEIIEGKHNTYNMYRERLDGVDGITFQKTQPWAKPVPWMVAILTRLPQVTVRKKLKEVGIETREFFKPLHQQLCLQGRVRAVQYDYDRSDRLYYYGLYLPSTPNLPEAKVDYVCDNLKRVLNG